MNLIVIDPHYCSREELKELQDYLDEQCWDWREEEPAEKVKPGYKCFAPNHTMYCPGCGDPININPVEEDDG